MSLGSGQRFVFNLIKSDRIKYDTFTRYLFASNFVSGKIVLDAACGSGFGTFFLAQEAKEVWGLDFSAESIDYAKRNFSRGNTKFEVVNLLEGDLPEDFFDTIVSFHTLEQTENPQKFLERLSRALKPGGTMILSTPNKKIISPYRVEPMGKFNKFEFYKKDLEKILPKNFSVSWFGQRNTFFLFANFFVRRLIRLSEIISRKNFGANLKILLLFCVKITNHETFIYCQCQDANGKSSWFADCQNV